MTGNSSISPRQHRAGGGSARAAEARPVHPRHSSAGHTFPAALVAGGKPGGSK